MELETINVHMEMRLSNHVQCVILNGGTSRWLNVTSGVPQGSVFGSTRFIVLYYVNIWSDILSKV